MRKTKTKDVFSLFLASLALLSSTSVTANEFSSNAARLQWAEVLEAENQGELKLSEEIVLESNTSEPTTSLTLKKGEVYTLDQIDGLDMISVTLVTLTKKNCVTRPVRQTEITLVTPAGTPADARAEVGVQRLTGGCSLSIFVEWKDLYRTSFFSL